MYSTAYGIKGKSSRFCKQTNRSRLRSISEALIRLQVSRRSRQRLRRRRPRLDAECERPRQPGPVRSCWRVPRNGQPRWNLRQCRPVPRRPGPRSWSQRWPHWPGSFVTASHPAAVPRGPETPAHSTGSTHSSAEHLRGAQSQQTIH